MKTNTMPYNLDPKGLSPASLEGPHQVLLTNFCATKLQGGDSWIHMLHLKKALNPNWTCTLSRNLKTKPIRPEPEGIWSRQIPEDVRTRCEYLSFSTGFHLCPPSLPWKDNGTIHISQPLQNLSDCSICRQKPQSLQDGNGPLVHPISNYTGVPDAVVCPDCSTRPFNTVRVLSPPKLIPCFNLTLPWDRKTRSWLFVWKALWSWQCKSGHL